MKRFMSFLLHRLTLAAIGFLLVAGLIWWVGPLFAFGGRHPLDGVGRRLFAIALVAVLFGLVVGVRAWRRRRTNQRLVAGLAAGPSSAEREAQALQQRFGQALNV